VPDYEVLEPILNSPHDEPAQHWNIEEGASPEKRQGANAKRVLGIDNQARKTKVQSESKDR
jgi:hypothetical protein